MARNPNGKGGGSEKGHGALYKKKYCKMLVKHMSQGFSFTSFGADVECSARTLHNWCDNHSEFREAKGIGQEKAKRFFEQIARMKIVGKNVVNKVTGEVMDPRRSDTAMLIFFLKTRFRDEYTEKIEIESNNTNYNINFVEESDKTDN